ncbi:Translation elongation factor EFG [Macleaya cordata]|uniref:Translation elongation factor EFG n=1 Tax=Macleaya cordata TaxID=56857 RepID=A0A200Q0K8_MACCD|nr:Translation elongation factor EFG [Macleaya cordata]
MEDDEGKIMADKLRRIMDLKNNIRNVTVVAHVEHGKSTLVDSLMAAASESSSSIKSTGTTLYYEMTDAALKNYKGERQGNEYIINLIDSPGHVDFSSEVNVALRITDGALVVVDCVKGVSVQTETVLRRAFEERVRPVLTVNKMDRCFLELQVDGEEAYQIFSRVIEDANVIMATYTDRLLGDVQFDPEKGNVGFSSGLHGWGFTLKSFANMYARKFCVDENKMMERLWGENYFDSATKKWTSRNTGSPTCKRGFVQFCYEPVKQIIKTCMNGEKEKLWLVLQKIGVTMKSEEKDLTGRALMKRVMQNWLPVSSAVVEMMIFHLPSPATAQKYRVENLYKGPLGDIYANAIRSCDPEGPLMLYVSKMIPTSDKGRFFAFGRVFAGKVSTGLKVRIMGPNYVPGQKGNLYVTSVQRTAIWMGKKHESVEDIPCGNTVSLMGLDQYIKMDATLTNEKEVDAHPIRAMVFSVSPVLRVAVQCKVASDLPKLVEGLKRLAKSDPMVVCSIEESGEHVVSGTGELHLQTCFSTLENEIMGGVEIVKTHPVVAFRETVIGGLDFKDCICSKNMKNLTLQARPLEVELADAIDEGLFGLQTNPKGRSKVIVERFGWDQDLAERIWCFGPDGIGPNILVDKCKGGFQHMGKIKDAIVAGFQLGTESGAMAGERMWGVCFDLHRVAFSVVPKSRMEKQIMKNMQMVLQGSQMAANPRLMEPIYLVEIRAPVDVLHHVYNVIHEKRGQVIQEVLWPDTPLYNIRAYLPVIESFGISGQLTAATSGKATIVCMFDHWEVMPFDPLEAGSRAAQVVADIRRRKGLREMMRNPRVR